MINKNIKSLTEGTQDILNKIGLKHTTNLLNNADKQDERVKAAHEAILGGTGHRHLTLGNAENPIPDNVKNHIEKTGGTFEGDMVRPRGSNRTVTIDKFLGRSTKSLEPQERKSILSSHQNWDRNRAKSEDEESDLVLSNHPGQVASCGTGTTNWSPSCAKLVRNSTSKTGYKTNGLPGAKALPAELEHGTMIAMKVKKGAVPDEHGTYHGRDILGRALVKQHVGKYGQIRYYREGSQYGKFSDKDKETLDDHLYNTQDSVGGEFRKNSNVYNDDGNYTRYELPHGETILSTFEKIPKYSTLSINQLLQHPLSTEADHNHILKAMNYHSDLRSDKFTDHYAALTSGKGNGDPRAILRLGGNKPYKDVDKIIKHLGANTDLAAELASRHPEYDRKMGELPNDQHFRGVYLSSIRHVDREQRLPTALESHFKSGGGTLGRVFGLMPHLNQAGHDAFIKHHGTHPDIVLSPHVTHDQLMSSLGHRDFPIDDVDYIVRHPNFDSNKFVENFNPANASDKMKQLFNRIA